MKDLCATDATLGGGIIGTLIDDLIIPPRDRGGAKSYWPLNESYNRAGALNNLHVASNGYFCRRIVFFVLYMSHPRRLH